LAKSLGQKKTEIQEDVNAAIPINDSDITFSEQEMALMVCDPQPEHFDLTALKDVAGVMDMKECHGV